MPDDPANMKLAAHSNLVSSHAQVQHACREIEKRLKHYPKVAIILGSGLGALGADVDNPTTIPYKDLPGFPLTSAAGHSGNLILGTISSVPVAVMQGRSHRYEGHSADRVVFPVRCLGALGITTLILTNAAGGLNPRFARGDIMVIDEHIHWLWNPVRQTVAIDRDSPPSPLAMAGQVSREKSPYSPDLIRRITQIALMNHCDLRRGTYLSTIGPTYETRAEYRMFRWMGADAVGMSTTAEVLAASKLGMNVLALSVITNVASTDLPQTTSHAEVVDAGQRAEPQMRHLIHQLLAMATNENQPVL